MIWHLTRIIIALTGLIILNLYHDSISSDPGTAIDNDLSYGLYLIVVLLGICYELVPPPKKIQISWGGLIISILIFGFLVFLRTPWGIIQFGVDPWGIEDIMFKNHWVTGILCFILGTSIIKAIKPDVR